MKSRFISWCYLLACVFSSTSCYYIPFQKNKDGEYLTNPPPNLEDAVITSSKQIVSVSDWVAWVGNSASKYWRNTKSTVASGYCCSSDDKSSFWGGDISYTCSDNSTIFPTGSQYFLCPVARSTSFWGASENFEFHVANNSKSITLICKILSQYAKNLFKKKTSSK